jgi:hypothetical protein
MADFHFGSGFWFLPIKCQIIACFGVKLLKKSKKYAQKHIF